MSDCEFRAMKNQWWLAKLDVHGNPRLVDGSHRTREGAEKAFLIYSRLGLIKDQRFAIAEVRLTELEVFRGVVNDEAITTLNTIGLRPDDKD